MLFCMFLQCWVQLIDSQSGLFVASVVFYSYFVPSLSIAFSFFSIVSTFNGLIRRIVYKTR